MAFVLDWQKKLGYRSDPFVALPGTGVKAFFVDRERERERLNLFLIKQQRFGILAGPDGSGKTTLLRWLEAELHGTRTAALPVDERVARDYKAFFSLLLDASLSAFERNITKPHKKLAGEGLASFLLARLAKRRLVLIVDDAQWLAKENKDLIRLLLEKCAGVQVILAVERSLKEHEMYGEDRLGLELEALPPEGLGELLARRIALAGGTGTWPFDDAELQRLITAAKGSPVRLLALARDRAIELSLRAGKPPEAQRPAKREEPPAPVVPKKATEKTSEKEPEKAKEKKQAPAANGIVKEQPKKWFSIRFVKEDDLKKEEEMLDKRVLRPSARAREESHRLEEALGAAGQERHAKREKAAEDIDVDAVIKSLAEELEPKKQQR